MSGNLLHRLRAGLLVALAALSPLCGGIQTASAELSPSLVLMPIKSFTGFVDSVPVPYGGGTIPSGPISVSLDPTAANVFGLDNVLEEGYIDVTLILDSPLFSALGESPAIRIVESGPAYVGLIDPFPGSPATSPAASDLPCECDCDPGFDFYFFAALTGGGTVENGLFQGTKFSNVNAYQGTGLFGSWIVRPNSIVTWDIGDNGSVTFPDGSVVTGVGGRGTLVVAPEPSSLALAAAGLAGSFLVARRRLFRRRTAGDVRETTLGSAQRTLSHLG